MIRTILFLLVTGTVLWSVPVSRDWILTRARRFYAWRMDENRRKTQYDVLVTGGLHQELLLAREARKNVKLEARLDWIEKRMGL